MFACILMGLVAKRVTDKRILKVILGDGRVDKGVRTRASAVGAEVAYQERATAALGG